MVDFAKLNDPVWRAERKAEREAQEKIQEEKDRQLRSMLDLCDAQFEGLSPQERSLVRSIENARVCFSRPPSEAQMKWLGDIVRKIEAPKKASIPSPRFSFQRKNMSTQLKPVVDLGPRFDALFDDAFQGLQMYYPSRLTPENRAAVREAAMGSYQDTGNDQQDYVRIRDGIEAHISRQIRDEAALDLERPRGG